MHLFKQDLFITLVDVDIEVDPSSSLPATATHIVDEFLGAGRFRNADVVDEMAVGKVAEGGAMDITAIVRVVIAKAAEGIAMDVVATVGALVANGVDARLDVFDGVSDGDGSESRGGRDHEWGSGRSAGTHERGS